MIKGFIARIFRRKDTTGTEKYKAFFSLNLKKRPRQVVVAGSFNRWSCFSHPMHLSPAGVWETTIMLEPGAYRYCFLVDNSTWVLDPLAESALNKYGGNDSILVVRVPEAAPVLESAAVAQEQYA